MLSLAADLTDGLAEQVWGGAEAAEMLSVVTSGEVMSAALRLDGALFDLHLQRDGEKDARVIKGARRRGSRERSRKPRLNR